MSQSYEITILYKELTIRTKTFDELLCLHAGEAGRQVLLF